MPCFWNVRLIVASEGHRVGSCEEVINGPINYFSCFKAESASYFLSLISKCEMRLSIDHFGPCKSWEINVKHFFAFMFPLVFLSWNHIRFNNGKSLIRSEKLKVFKITLKEVVIHIFKNLNSFCIEILKLKIRVVLPHVSYCLRCIRFSKQNACNVSCRWHSFALCCFDLVFYFLFYISHVFSEFTILFL